MSGVLPKRAIKIANLTLGGLATLASLSQLTFLVTDFNVFVQSLYAIALSALIVYLEFKVPSNLYKYASFYFSFFGRGLLHILLGIMLFHGGPFKLITALFLVLSGIAYCLFQFLPMVEEPDNFKIAGSSLSIGDDEFDDDDEVI